MENPLRANQQRVDRADDSKQESYWLMWYCKQHLVNWFSIGCSARISSSSKTKNKKQKKIKFLENDNKKNKKKKNLCFILAGRSFGYGCKTRVTLIGSWVLEPGGKKNLKREIRLGNFI